MQTQNLSSSFFFFFSFPFIYLFIYFLFYFFENQDQENIMANHKIAYLNDRHTSVFVDPLLLSPLLCSLKTERDDTKGLRERGMTSGAYSEG